jgi:hypothetical protein
MISPKYVSLFLIVLVLAACVPAAATGACQDVNGLAAALEAQGAEVEVAEVVTQDFFSVPARRLVVNGDDLQVFAYASQQAAQADAEQISGGGYIIGTSIVDWIATPHFYQCGQLIVLYLGDNAEVLGLLEGVLGAPLSTE